MKLLLFSDVHCDLKACRNLVSKSVDVDVVIGAGDIGNIRRGLPETIDALSSISKPTILVPGNSESDDELQHACTDWSSAYVIHGNGCQIDGIDFFGIGGGIPVTPFGSWSFDFTEEEADTLLSDCPRNAVLISHSPPHGVVDLSSSGRRLGSKTIRRIIEERSPKLVVCGHIHESWEQTGYIGNIPVVNAGPNGVVFEIP